RATWLVLLRGGEVLLERRPGTGIWGGLWTFPEFSTAYQIRKRKRLPPFEHGFTHFRLRVQPLLCQVEKLRERPGQMWLPLNDAVAAAVPAPVKALLAQLARE
ncbi:MAG: NUDIX domain-containing protein, partial [Pseudomonadota bacterium]